MSEPFIGEIRMTGHSFPPRGWAFCNGQLLSIDQNQALFSLIGTTYGGNGQTTFALPDLRGRVPVHQGTGPGLSTYVQGQAGGTEEVTLNFTQIPAHNHPFAANASAATALAPADNFPGATPRGTNPLYATTGGATMAASAAGNTGNNQPHENVQPYLCASFIIALEGIFPSRN
jgi:microcystin-dependent protein